MIIHPTLKSSIAKFLILLTAINLISPSIAFALTEGPSAPEFSNFEPVDTTDLVNLATGELAYTLPVLEVPGPGGGYPLALSYHSGIKVEQEASWVGLGWALNAGAITRTVNGFADDNIETKKLVRDYWGGGESKTKAFTLGINIPNTGIGLNYTLARTRDTFKGFSVNHYGGIAVAPGHFSVAGFGVRPTLGLSVGPNGMEPNAQIELGLINRSKPSGGMTAIASHNFDLTQKGSGGAARISTSKDVGAFQIAFLNVGVKEFYTRYWSDQTNALYSTGTLYPKIARDKIGADHFAATADTYSEFRSYAFDVRHIIDLESEDLLDDADPNKQNGGSFPNYDQYSVTAQGLGGSIQPFIFESGDMAGQNTVLRDDIWGRVYTSQYIVEHKSLKKFSPEKKVDFRFLGDFSNSIAITPPLIDQIGSSYSVPDPVIEVNQTGFESTSTKQKLAGSKNIEWFTTAQIRSGEASGLQFMDYYPNRSDRPATRDVYNNYLQPEATLPYQFPFLYGTGEGAFTGEKYEDADPYEEVVHRNFKSLRPVSYNLNQKIGGFMITNEEGVTYHYALPVYSFNEYTRNKLKHPKKEVPTFTDYYSDEPYAYSWLLTAITGPDFVDRGGPNGNPNGMVDDADFGYWVKFEYGRWSDNYQWRTPHTGYMSDIESEYESFSYGVKELYYLDQIETKTHKALFIKSKRKDGRGVTSRLEGGSNPRRYKMEYKTGSEPFGSVTFSVSPVSQLKLDAIYLVEKANLQGVPINKASGTKYAYMSAQHEFPYMGTAYNSTIPFSQPLTTVSIVQGTDFIKAKYHNDNLVLDDSDVDLQLLKSKATRVVEFEADYKLAKNTPNSIGYLSDIQGANLVSVGFCSPGEIDTDKDFEWPKNVPAGCGDQSRGGMQSPFACFEDDKQLFFSTEPLGSFYAIQGTYSCPLPFDDFRGSELQYEHTGKLTLNSIRFLGRQGSDDLPPITFKYNKNPDYEKEKYDEWGYYKSDLQPSLENHNRLITPASSLNVDAWSLSEIKHSQGGKTVIEYEANDCRLSVYNNDLIMATKAIVREGSNVRISFAQKGFDLASMFFVGQIIDLQVFIMNTRIGWSSVLANSLQDEQLSSGSSAIVSAIDPDYITLTYPQLFDALAPSKTITVSGDQFLAQPWVISGFVKVPRGNLNFTGGIRVKELSMFDQADINSVAYEYKAPGGSLSSGITSFHPFNLPSIIYPTEVDLFNNLLSKPENRTKRRTLLKARASFQKVINNAVADVLRFSADAPAPGSIYEYVKVRAKFNGTNLPTYKVYNFQTFSPTMLQMVKSDNGSGSGMQRSVGIVNKIAQVGSLKKVEVYNQQGIPLNSTSYNYLLDNEVSSSETAIAQTKQGIISQTFHRHITVKDFQFSGTEWPLSLTTLSTKQKGVVTSKQDFANAITSIKSIDYKNGLETEVQHLEFDFYSGHVTRELQVDGYGNRYMTVTQPAYRVPEYSGMTQTQLNSGFSGMGLKIKNANNKHMLSQVASVTQYRVDQSNIPMAIKSAVVDTWSTQVPLSDGNTHPGWRKRSSFVFTGSEAVVTGPDGLYPSGQFQNFNSWNSDNAPLGWTKNRTVTRISRYSVPQEVVDQNDIYSSVKMNGDFTKVLATADNSKYPEFAFAGYEEMPDLNGFVGGGVEVSPNFSSVSHTGLRSASANNGQRGFTYRFTNSGEKRFTVSFWANQPDAAIRFRLNGSSIQTATKSVHVASGWYLMQADVLIPASAQVEIWCEANISGATLFDDFRIHPLKAAMVSYVYNQWGELSHILDNNNLYTEYEYDGLGRLTKVNRETFQFGKANVSEVVYKYNNQN